jgi:hypothetical protein
VTCLLMQPTGRESQATDQDRTAAPVTAPLITPA